jgi:hypothetical protein
VEEKHVFAGRGEAAPSMVQRNCGTHFRTVGQQKAQRLQVGHSSTPRKQQPEQ